MNRIMYWLINLIGVILMFILPLIVFLICIVAFNTKPLNMSASLFLVFAAFILHVLGNVLFVNTFSFIFNTPTIFLNFVSLFYNIITLKIVSYLVEEPRGNSSFYSSSWFTVNFAVSGIPFFLFLLLDVRSEFTD